MASNYTSNYNLPLWAAEDDFLRTEFNEAHQKIDAALGEKADADALAAVETQVETRPWIVTGTYTGDGQTSKTVTLGFQPRLVLVVSGGGLNAQRIHECGAQLAFPGVSTAMLTVTADGFTVAGEGNLGMNSDRSSLNPFFYLALR